MSKITALINLSLSTIGVCLGLLASISFYFLGNNMAVFWAFLSAGIALLNFHLHYLYFKEKMEEWHSEETMSAIMSFSAVISTCVLGLLIWFIFRISYEHLHIYPIKDSLIITSVWTFMTAKWSLLLFRSSRNYRKLLLQRHSPLLLP